ncbi:MAG: hypothetical protein OHK0012_27630 [Synechococcales cyanobacterium]
MTPEQENNLIATVERLDGTVERLDGAVERLDVTVEQLGRKVEQLDEKVEQLDVRVQRLDENQYLILNQVKNLDVKFDAFQKGTDAMVRMATSLITGATISIIVGFVFLLVKEGSR